MSLYSKYKIFTDSYNSHQKINFIIMVHHNFYLFILLATTFSFFYEASSAKFINVVSFGAKPDGNSDSTKSFLSAWSSACTSREQATIYVPQGSFLLKQVTFSGPCKNKVEFKIDGTLVAPKDYWSLGGSGEYWILFMKVDKLKIQGGTIDGKGSGYWRCRRSGKNCPAGARVCVNN